MRYKSQADAGSMLNTPPTFAWYLAGLVFAWLRQQGGLAVVGETITSVRRKSCMQRSIILMFYTNPVARSYRSLMNVPFTPGAARTGYGEFLAQAELRRVW